MQTNGLIDDDLLKLFAGAPGIHVIVYNLPQA